ncbi:MAG TPA: hypothetical protein VMB27_17170 [Solirubrobacteraceae bacterium]|nr:hypothetical protein [Solirubrobacteraceae bacterium]
MVFAREDVVRLAVVRLAVELELFFDAVVLAFFVALEFVRDAVDAFCVIAARSLSKSFSACLLVFDASRRSDVSAAVTSL